MLWLIMIIILNMNMTLADNIGDQRLTSSDDEEGVEEGCSSGGNKRKRRVGTQDEGLSRKCARQNIQGKGTGRTPTAASVTPHNKMLPPGKRRAGLSGVSSMHIEGGPGIAVTGSGASVSSMSQVVSTSESVHYSESSAVREFVRSHVLSCLPEKKTIFLLFRSNLWFEIGKQRS